jgi:hypothetical protein
MVGGVRGDWNQIVYWSRLVDCGPKAPAGFEQNWIPTVPGRNWFAYFRFYQPTEAYFDRSWPLPDFERLPS